MKLTHKKLLDVLVYEKDTGIFRWRIPRKGVRAGEVAGGDDGDGYIRIKV